ncbi:hypothetical protein [Streptomyces xiaopingdaonensis]|uniref:hypothetical protein n=1 Tax=Streptomyces xiaopingdaonensis TaxID=1565415 RepID=UPI00030B83BB|nr:hypothetical protein [Streptomyces xiaopingdaonensis]
MSESDVPHEREPAPRRDEADGQGPADSDELGRRVAQLRREIEQHLRDLWDSAG